MRKLLVLLIWGLFLGNSIHAQYHLSELGLSLGAGSSVPLGYKNIGVGAGFNGNAFFSHYVCGKRYGYHASLGFRTFSASGKPGLAYPPTILAEKSSFAYHFFDVGFFFKIRKQTFHRPHELALLIGPKIDVLYASRFKYQGKGEAQRNDAFKDVFPFQPGIHLSLLVKRKLLNQSFYIEPGAEYYFVPQLTTTEGKLSQLYIFINVGVTFWNSKHFGFK